MCFAKAPIKSFGTLRARFNSFFIKEICLDSFFDKFSILMELSKSENSLDVCRLCAITIRHACSSALSTNAPEGIIAS